MTMDTLRAYRRWRRGTMYGISKADFTRRALSHMLGRGPCIRRGQISAYCPCYWKNPWIDRVYL